MGLQRTNNEDTCWADDDEQYYLVADGVGGNAAGEVASRIFLETVQETFASSFLLDPDDVAVAINQCFYFAHEGILDNVKEHPERKGMGCTAEVLVLIDDTAVIGHVGDSRSYLFRSGKLEQLTDDHSFVFEQVKAGVISPEEAKTHRFRNLILRAVGIEEEVEADVIMRDVEPGDLFLLCTDGLTDLIADSEICEVLLAENDLEVKGNRLIDMANQAGGKDNISVVLVEAQLEG